MALKILRLKGVEINPYIIELARLRIEVFKEYPYLYEGNLDYEMNYLKTYTNSSDSVMILVVDGDKIVGASTAIPLKYEMQEVQTPFLEVGMKIEDIFYFGESILNKHYRGQGVYRHFFNEREAAAKDYGCRLFTFCAVDRPPDHPKKPPHYKPLDEIWEHFGYKKHPEIYTYFKWPEIGETYQFTNRMVFWLKESA